MSNKNGFILVDAVAAIMIGMLIFMPITALLQNSLSMYKHSKELRLSAMYGRMGMEESRIHDFTNNPLFTEYQQWNGSSYIVHGHRYEISEFLFRYEVEVQAPSGKIYIFKRLAAKKTE